MFLHYTSLVSIHKQDTQKAFGVASYKSHGLNALILLVNRQECYVVSKKSSPNSVIGNQWKNAMKVMMRVIMWVLDRVKVEVVLSLVMMV